jgi:hypothetical protein
LWGTQDPARINRKPKDDGLRAAQALAAKLERGALEDGFTLRDVRRNQWRSLTTDEAIQAALDWLEETTGCAASSTGGTGLTDELLAEGALRSDGGRVDYRAGVSPKFVT